jgi:hypothetical protein
VWPATARNAVPLPPSRRNYWGFANDWKLEVAAALLVVFLNKGPEMFLISIHKAAHATVGKRFPQAAAAGLAPPPSG